MRAGLWLFPFHSNPLFNWEACRLHPHNVGIGLLVFHYLVQLGGVAAPNSGHDISPSGLGNVNIVFGGLVRKRRRYLKKRIDEVRGHFA
uniref:Uncharacterized protein n=1 Tax=Picea glauca TaxID=3330 RepID=A0A124GNR5_PICGL|nr:hypothetical protein ABT39_MTgene2882 [Picea glauca]QHR87590.1 hypothetical protein Q903MT_gene1601 [Picea sitchensis]